MQHSHEVTWRDEGDSNTMKLHAAPLKGGDRMLKWYVKVQNELGWLQGAYSNYTDFCTVNTNWNPDHVQRLPNGQWRRAWARNYVAEAGQGGRVRRLLRPADQAEVRCEDVLHGRPHGRHPLALLRLRRTRAWRRNVRSHLLCLRATVAQRSTVYGPTQSEATYQWLYAGLESGSYGWVYTPYNLLTEPLDVAFHLMKIHPLQCDYGMGYTHYYLERLDKQWRTVPKRRLHRPVPGHDHRLRKHRLVGQRLGLGQSVRCRGNGTVLLHDAAVAAAICLRAAAEDRVRGRCRAMANAEPGTGDGRGCRLAIARAIQKRYRSLCEPLRQRATGPSRITKGGQ